MRGYTGSEVADQWSVLLMVQYNRQKVHFQQYLGIGVIPKNVLLYAVEHLTFFVDSRNPLQYLTLGFWGKTYPSNITHRSHGEILVKS